MANEGKCRSCGASILWAETEAGKKVPLDAKEILVFAVGQDGVARSGKARLNHFVTCPNADSHRKRPNGGGAVASAPASAPDDVPVSVEAFKVTTHQMVLSLGCGMCPGCRREKSPKQTLCRVCYGGLSPIVKNRLYRMVGDGYEEAVAEAFRELRFDRFWMPPGAAAVRAAPVERPPAGGVHGSLLGELGANGA